MGDCGGTVGGLRGDCPGVGDGALGAAWAPAKRPPAPWAAAGASHHIFSRNMRIARPIAEYVYSILIALKERARDRAAFGGSGARATVEGNYY